MIFLLFLNFLYSQQVDFGVIFAPGPYSLTSSTPTFSSTDTLRIVESLSILTDITKKEITKYLKKDFTAGNILKAYVIAQKSSSTLESILKKIEKEKRFEVVASSLSISYDLVLKEYLELKRKFVELIEKNEKRKD